MDKLKELKPKIAALKQQMENPWSAPPKVKETVTNKTVPKINEAIEEDEFQVQIVVSDQLQSLSYSRLKVKIHDKAAGEKELVGHYFYPGKDEDHYTQILKIPESKAKTFKNQKITLSMKQNYCGGLMEKNIY